MKKICITIVIALLINTAFDRCMAQWIPVYQDNNAHFYDGAFPTDYTGFVAASDTGGAVVLKTIDGGITWHKKYISGWNGISKIAMTDSSSGYLIKGGVPVQILKTNDGFATYTVHNLDSSFTVQALELLNDSTGFYLNNAARLRKFEHSGSSFSYIIDTLSGGQNLQFVNSHTGYLDTGNGLLMTSDTGMSWSFVNNNPGFFCVEFNFADSLKGYFSDLNMIYKTSDGGITFQQQYNFPNTYCFAVNGNFCMAANDTGKVAYTTDGGLTWQAETTGINVVAPEAYNVITTPGGYCFLFSEFCGEIRKRESLISGISSAAAACRILIYPNPFSTQITLETNKLFKDATLKVYNSLGQTVKQITRIAIGPGQTFTLNRDNLPGGLYFIRLIQDDKTFLTDKITIAD